MTTIKRINNYNEISNDLLLLADPDLNKINEYRINSIFFGAILDKHMIGIICLKDLDHNKIEIMNLSVFERFQNKGIGRRLLEESIRYAKNNSFNELIIKTGNSSLPQLSLYMKTGFRISDVNYNYFIDHYNGKIYENNILCSDQVILKYKIYTENEISKKIEEYWNGFTTKNPQFKDCKYSVWNFGYGDYQANNLLSLVIQGKKIGTSSALDLYEDDDELPKEGDISIITFGNDLPGCIITNTSVVIKKFNEITELDAKNEGEGDFSLNYWRTTHESFFKKEYKNLNKEFNYNISIVYELFKVIYI